MKILVNDIEKEINVPPIGTILDVVMQIEQNLEPNHIITKITLNDKLLNSDWYHNAKNIYVLDDDKLELLTEHSNIVAVETLQNLRKQHKSLLEDLENIADGFRIESEEIANKHFIQGIENLQWFFNIIVTALEMMNKKTTDFEYDGKSVDDIISEIGVKLEEVIQIQQNRNWVLLADFIEYEIIPLLQNLTTFLKSF